MVYIYDGTYEGFLTCLYRCLVTREWPEDIAAAQSAQDNLFARGGEAVLSDTETAQKCQARMRKKLGPYPLQHIFRAFFSDLPGRELLILRYVRLGMEVGAELDRYLADERVRKIHDLSRKVSCEIHRMHGLLRFQELADGVCYARMSPDHDIIAFLPGYFSRRLSAQRWIIHDQKREKAVVYEGRNWYITPIRQKRPLAFSQEEQYYRRLWKRYFRDISLKERKNPTLQRKWMPQRYWRHLVEMDTHEEGDPPGASG